MKSYEREISGDLPATEQYLTKEDIYAANSALLLEIWQEIEEELKNYRMINQELKQEILLKRLNVPKLSLCTVKITNYLSVVHLN